MKYITVPNTIEAMKKLDLDQCQSNELTEISLSDDEYSQLWESDIFDILNHELELIIDDYEDESIIGEKKLELAKNIIIQYKNENNVNSPVINKLIDQIDLAKSCNTGIFFYF